MASLGLPSGWDFWAHTTGATASYPAGNGTATGTAASSVVYAAGATAVYQVIVTVAAAETLILTDKDGTAIAGHSWAIAEAQAVPFPIAIGGPNGVKFLGGVGADSSGANLRFTVYFERTD